MKRLRLLLLVSTLVAVVLIFYYRHLSAVRIETISLRSVLTGRSLPYKVILPRWYGLPGSSRYPVLYLLHGHGGDYTSWVANTTLADSLSNYNLIVVTPEGGEGWYTDSATLDADRFESFIVKELLPDVEKRFRVIPERKGRGIAGYSMGGYGALKYGLKYPQLFAFAGSLSGAFDAPNRVDNASIMKSFGPINSPTREANDLERVAALASPTSLPSLYFDCGNDDPWLLANRKLHAELQRLGIQHEYREMPGSHDWAYWNRQMLELLPRAAAAISPKQP